MFRKILLVSEMVALTFSNCNVLLHRFSSSPLSLASGLQKSTTERCSVCGSEGHVVSREGWLRELFGMLVWLGHAVKYKENT